MKKVILTRGLPGSGKTYWAKSVLQNEPGKWKRVNKDDLRAMLDNSKWSRDNEKFVVELRDQIIRQAMTHGVNIIVDDTNFNPAHEEKIQQIVKVNNEMNKELDGQEDYEVEIKDFTNVTLDECLQRDKLRLNSVGEKVIRDMYNKYIRKIPVIELDPKLPSCIICDIDGTLAHMKGRGPFEWEKVGTDEIDPTILGILTSYWMTNEQNPELEPIRILLVSGRDSVCRTQTLDWLEKFDVPYDHLYMRPEGDMRRDSIVKTEIYEREIKGKYNVAFILDDRDQMVQTWRELGLKCLQVAEGDF